MINFQNRAISASAGTGKTYRLAHRYIGLMAAGVEPDRICALTFSRKAAGEIFDEIVKHLCAAATHVGKRASTCETIKKEGLIIAPDQPALYVRLLRKLMNHEHRLRIGTLDSFILGVVRAFPLELGIPPETQPINGDGGEAAAMRQAILTRLFDPTERHGAKGESDGAAFLGAFRQACFGQESKNLVSVLDELVCRHYEFFSQHNSEVWQWGDPSLIWLPDERWWERRGRKEQSIPADLPARLATAFGPGRNPENLGKACAGIAEAAMAHAANKPWPELNKTVFPQLVSSVVHDTEPVVNYSKKGYTIPADLWPPLRAAIGKLISVEATRALARTAGLRAVLERYDALYTEALSIGGHFTFDDLSRLLGADGLSPSRRQDVPNRLYIDYRLDGKLDHWLMDEFQDTSNTQWAALANLIDEVIMEDDKERSFFYVGDVKQSIYGWRGGNHRLFGDVLKHYENAGKRLVERETISKCHRSLPAIIEVVNKVFDGLSGWEPELGPGLGPRANAVAAFLSEWQKHESARAGEGSGFAALLEYVPRKKGGSIDEGGREGEEGSDDPAEFETVAKVLRQIQPTQRGLTVAVLVRGNTAGRACVDVLRRLLPDVPAVHEGTGGIVDNPVVTVLLALVRYSAHPGDTVALRHLQMSPLAGLPEMKDLDVLPRTLLASIQETGFAGTLRQWGGRLGNLDDFGRQRLRELLAAAEQFDAVGDRSADAFADYIDAYQIKANAAAGTVRVMTIHQAKGLGFDVVIVPFSARSRSFEKPGENGLMAGDNWVFDPPCIQALEAAGGNALRALEAARTDANFSQLCVLYVALTRAQQALYMIVPEKGKSSTAVREADLLRERLKTDNGEGEWTDGLKRIFATGDPAWFEKTGKKVQVGPDSQAAKVQVTFSAEVPRREPSKDHSVGRLLPAAWLFGAKSGDVLAFGSAIHRLFQRIEWFEDTDVESIIAEWRKEDTEPAVILEEVAQQFRSCLAKDEIRHMLARPAGATGADVWREAPFNVVIEIAGQRQIMAGRFDRLVVERNSVGRPVKATVFDFKSNIVENAADLNKAADGYTSQMDDYARAAGRLLALPRENVSTVLLFTRSGWVRRR